MENYIQEGKTITLAAPYDRTSGQGAQVGSIFGVATGDVLSGIDGEFMTEGVFTLTKATGTAWTQGEKIYWDNSNKRCSDDGTVGQLIGVATEAAASDATTGIVRLNGVAPASAEGPQAAIVVLTDSTGLSGTHDDTLAATTVPADLTGGESPTEAEHNALLAVVRVMAQNDSDIAQKVLELRAAMVAAGIIAA